MTRRLVVSFRHRREAGASADFTQVAASLVTRASALGGRVVAWDASAFSVSFAHDAIEDALELVTQEVPESGGRRGLPSPVSAGIAEGPLDVTADLGPRAALAHGDVLERARAFARLARAGEIVLDPSLEAVRSGRVLTRGARLGVHAKRRLRGLLLDEERPLRGDPTPLLGRIQTPERVGAVPVLALAPGRLASVRAARGLGGSRLLGELGCVLELRPVLGEPLGALRVALAAATPVLSELEHEHAATIESLLASEGLDLESTISAIAGLLRARAVSPLIGVDDAEHVDRDSLEVVSGLLARGAAAAVLRVTDALPDVFAQTRLHQTLELTPLSETESSSLAGAFVAGALADRACQRWGKRGGGVPLAIREALCEALESGDLIEEGSEIVVRANLSGRGTPKPAEHFIARRARFLPEGARRLLDESTALVTALTPRLGYAASTEIAREALETGRRVYDLVLSKNLMSREELDLLLRPEALTRPQPSTASRP